MPLSFSASIKAWYTVEPFFTVTLLPSIHMPAGVRIDTVTVISSFASGGFTGTSGSPLPVAWPGFTAVLLKL